MLFGIMPLTNLGPQSGAEATAVQTFHVIGALPGNRAGVWTAAVDRRSRPLLDLNKEKRLAVEKT